MKEEYKEFAARFAQTIVDEDFDAARRFFAPWLQGEVSAADFRAQFEKWLLEMNGYWDLDELIFPDEFHIDHNDCSLESLREDEGWREPRKISDEVTDENFRQWMIIQFTPDGTDERALPDAWVDFWFILVETGGELRIGFYELTDVD